MDENFEVRIYGEKCATEWERKRPAVLFRPRLFVDGDSYCALYGDDVISGVAGFGNTAAEAMADFDKNWSSSKANPHRGDAQRMDAIVSEAVAKVAAENTELRARNEKVEAALAKRQEMNCYYCGAVVKRDGRTQEEFDNEWKGHLVECDKRPEMQLLRYICWLVEAHEIQDTAGGLFEVEMTKAREWSEARDLRMKAEGRREGLEEAAEECDRLEGCSSGFVSRKLMQLAAQAGEVKP